MMLMENRYSLKQALHIPIVILATLDTKFTYGPKVNQNIFASPLGNYVHGQPRSLPLRQKQLTSLYRTVIMMQLVHRN